MRYKSVFTSVFVGFLTWCLLVLVAPVSAAVSFEQQINIINQEFSTADTAGPADNSLGLIRWNGDNYTGESVYFEVIVKCDACTGGNDQVTAGLYSAAGSLVTDSNISTQSETYERIRTSSNIAGNLTNNTNYTVRISRDATAGNAYIKAARLIVIQSADTISNTQTQIELGGATTTTNTAYVLLPVPKTFRYQANAYSPTPTVTFQATLKSSTSDSTAYAALSTTSNCSSTINDSEVSVIGNSWALGPSNSFTLNNGSSYYVCIKADSGYTASIANAKLVLTQTTSIGITSLETYALMINRYVTDSDSTYTAQNFPIQFVPTNNAGARFYYYFESMINTTANTGYARLYNVSDTAEIADSEVSTTNTAYTRARSKELTSMPTETKILDTEVKNSSSSDTAVASSWLITRLYAYPYLTFNLESVAADVTTNGITTSVASDVTKLDFGYLIPSTPKYIAHKLTATTNATSGYAVNVKLTNTLQGYYPANIIEEFPATWNSPQAWTEPTGTAPNVNSGWIGANTSDTRVSGWGSGSGLFGSIGTTNRKVMESSGTDSGTSAYVTYAIEVNQYQPKDNYAGTIVYSIVPTY